MNANWRASLWAFAVTCALASVIVLESPAILYLVISVAMVIPLSYIDSLGLVDVGQKGSEWFKPNLLGFGLAALAFWLLLFAILRVEFRVARKSNDT